MFFVHALQFLPRGVRWGGLSFFFCTPWFAFLAPPYSLLLIKKKVAFLSQHQCLAFDIEGK